MDALNLALGESEGPFPRASLAAAGAVETWLGEGPALAAEDRLKANLKAARVSDAASGATEWGTHRSDLEVIYLGRALGNAPLRAAECSTGEQRALLLSIALAEARLTKRRRGQAPILLLDEAVSHLDGQRREALFGEISGPRPAGLADRDGPRPVPPARRPGAVFRGRGWPRPFPVEIPALFEPMTSSEP